MWCLECGRKVYTYQGLCRVCAPELHRQHDEISAMIAERSRAFEGKTGKKPLAAWLEFEAFMGVAE